MLLIAFAEGSPIADVKPTQFFPLVLTCFLLLHRHIHLRPLLNIQYWGALSARKKKWYSTKPTFWRSGMGKAWKFEISQFLVISGVLRFFTRFGRPFHYIIWKRQSWLKIWKRQSQKIGWYAWAKLSQQLKTGLQHIFCRNEKAKHKYRGNLRAYRGNLREYRGNLRTYVSTILKPTFPACVAMAQKFQDPASLSFFSTEPILRIHGAQT